MSRNPTLECIKLLEERTDKLLSCVVDLQKRVIALETKVKRLEKDKLELLEE